MSKKEPRRFLKIGVMSLLLIKKFLLFQYSKAIFSLPTRGAILTLSHKTNLLIVFSNEHKFLRKILLFDLEIRVWILKQ